MSPLDVLLWVAVPYAVAAVFVSSMFTPWAVVWFTPPVAFCGTMWFRAGLPSPRSYLAMARLAPGGVLYFSNNFRKFQLEDNLAERYAVEEITARTIDPDFARNSKIHRAWKIMAR